MENAKFAVRLEDASWVDRSGKVLDSKTAFFGWKVTHNIVWLDLILCMDKVGADNSQKGDVAVGGETFVCEKGTTSKDKYSTNSKH